VRWLWTHTARMRVRRSELDAWPASPWRKVANGAEPDFTNFAQIKDDPQFIDCLDYIFISPGVEVAEVMQLPHRSEVKGPFPAPNEPSDHILLAATLRIPGQLEPADSTSK